MAVTSDYVLSSYTRAVAELSAVESFWNPFQLIYSKVDGGSLNSWVGFISSMVRVGAAILVLMATLRLISILMDELHEVPAATAIVGVLLEMALCGALLFQYTWFAEIFPNIFFKLTKVIFTDYGAAIMKDMGHGLSVVAKEKVSENKWYSINFSLSSIPQLISSVLSALAIVLMWVISKYQAVIYTFWYLIGPLLLPFYLFKPFRGIAVSWFRSLLGASFMGIVGSILFILMHRSAWLMKAFASGHNNDYISAMVFSLCCLFLVFSIPSLSTNIWNGITVSLSKGVYGASTAFGAASGAAIIGAGGAAMSSGLATRGVGGAVGALSRFRQNSGSGMGFGGRLLDSVQHRSEGRSPGGVFDRIHDAGTAMTNIGGKALLSQLPSTLGRAAGAFGRKSGHRPSISDRANETAKAAELIGARAKEKFGAEAAANIDFGKWNFSRRSGESFDNAVNRHMEPIERQIQNGKDASEIRSHISKHYGEEAAAQVYVDPKRNWRLPTDDTRPDAIAQAARQAYHKNRLLGDTGAVRQAAESIVGPDRAAKIDWAEVKPLNMKRGQTREDAANQYAMTLLYRARVFTPDEVQAHDHKAIRKEISRKLGSDEKANAVQIPTDWRVKAKRGQSREDAIKGSTVALLQEKGLIDRSGQNRIGERHSVRSRKRNKDAKDAARKEKKNGSAGTKGDLA